MSNLIPDQDQMPPPPPKSDRVWSDQQQAIFGWFESGKRHLVVVARAGTGKTTTIIHGVRFAPERSILLCAFNKRIADELQTRLTNPNAVARTLHSVGYGSVRRNWEGLNVCGGTERAMALAHQVCDPRVPDPIRKLVSRLHTKGREIVPHADKLGDLTDILYQFDCDPDEEWEEDGYDARFVEEKALLAMDLAAKTKPISTGIDFADMIFLPIRNHWLRKSFDMVVVDEAQDMSMAQLEIAQGVCRGRICIVGDDRQAIYGFRGADSGSIARLKRELNAVELGLTTTYRCGRLIVDEAKRLVPDFGCGTDFDGTIRSITVEKLVDEAQLGNFVLSRINAPLASIAMQLIKARKRARIAGRDLGSGMVALMHRLGGDTNSIPEFLKRLDHWRHRTITRLIHAGKEEKCARIDDQADTMIALAEGATGMRELEARIDELFTDNGLGSAGVITCSSVHRAKGLEANRVFILKDTLKRRADGGGEEDNIEYVAITRTKQELVWVQGLN